MIRITAEQIYVLRNSTGKPFTDLIDRLVRSSAATLGIPPSAVLDNPRTNYPDGGVDTQVTVGSASDPSGYLNGLTVWQYKAVALKDFPDNKIKEEISGASKEYVRNLLKLGYAYRMCIADDGPAIRKTEVKALLDAEIRAVDPNAPKCIVLFASEIVAWVNTFPAIAAEMNGSSMTDFFHFNTWENQARAVTLTFVQTAESVVIFERVQGHLNWNIKPNTARLTVSGDAGVGKTRTVFEAIAALPGVAPLVLYTNDEDKALELARAAANHHNLYAVIVADECLDPTAYTLAKILLGVEHRVRLITIDNALEASAKSELRLDRMQTSTVENIVEVNFPDIDQNRRNRYCSLAEGYLRFAIFLCDNDALIVQQGHLGELMKDTKGYLGTLFGDDGPFDEEDLTALKVIALVERCGVIDNVSTELEQLCALRKLNPDDVKLRLHRMQKSNGLVGRAGRYFYVTPTPIAMVCFESAWSDWASLDPKAFLDNFPRDLVPSFLARMARAPQEVGKAVNAYFRDWEISRGGDIFSSANETEQLLLLVRAAPELMVPRLRSLVMASTPEQLNASYRSGRRSLVVEASELASFPQWFQDAEEILFSLARHETEPHLGNNATKVWSGLFPILTHVATPFEERFKKLRERIETGDAADKLLCVTALESAIDDRAIHMVSSTPYGNRIAPDHWRPKTYGELYGYLEESLASLGGLCSDADVSVREKAETAFVGSIRSLVFRGFTEQAKRGAGEISPHIRPVLRAELREFVLLNNSEHSPHTEEEKEQRAKFVDEWVAELTSTGIHDRIVEEIGTESWDHHLEQSEWEGRIREIALYFLQSEDDFEQQLPWLNSDKARSSVDFGVQLGRIDKNLVFLDRITAACRGTANPNLGRGYFAGASESSVPRLPSPDAENTRERLNSCLDALWNENAVLAFNVMTPSGDFVQSFVRAIAGVKERKLRSGFLHTFVAWNGPRHTSPAEARLAAETLLDAANAGDEDAAATGIEFIVFLLMRTDSQEKTEWLQTVFSDPSLDVLFGLLEQAILKTRKASHWYSQIFARALPANPDRATSILVRMMQSDSYETLEAASGLFPTVAAARPQKLMDELGDIMLSTERNYSFLFRKFPIVSLPEGVVLKWLEIHGLKGARLLARHVPGPLIGDKGPDLDAVTRFILERFGDDSEVFSNWAAGMHNGRVFAGSIADYTERRASMAEPFLNFPVEAVRRWARGEILFAEQNVEGFRLSEEERF